MKKTFRPDYAMAALAFGIIMIFSSCGEIPLVRLPSAQSVSFFWTDEADDAAASYAGSVRALSYAPDTDPTLDVYSEIYSRFGTKIGSVTPTHFRLMITGIYLFNDVRGYQFIASPPQDEDGYYPPGQISAVPVDFCDGTLTLFPDVPVPQDEYTGIMFEYFPSFYYTYDQSLHPSTDPYTLAGTIIEAELPGFSSNTEFMDRINFRKTSGSYDLPSWTDEEALPADTFRFSLSELEPSQRLTESSHIYQTDPGSPDLAAISPCFNIFVTGSDYKAIFPGVEGHPDSFNAGLNDTGTVPPGWYFDDAIQALVLPMDSVNIRGDSEGVVVEISWDTEDLIEIYDNDTPGDTSDDIAVLAANYWERMSITISSQ